jgi:hypothetical protein
VEPSFAKTKAKQIAPRDAISQLIIVTEPIAAKLAGNKAIPDPIMFPATIAEQANKPSFFFSILFFSNVQLFMLLVGLCYHRFLLQYKLRVGFFIKGSDVCV